MSRMSKSIEAEFSEDVQAFLTSCLSASNHNDLTRHLLSVTARFGVQQVTYLEFRKFGEFLIPLVARGSLPLAYGDRFILEKQYRTDPFMKKASCTDLPFTWQEALQGEPLTDNLKRFLEICAKFGMSDGYFVPFHGPTGSVKTVSYTGPINSGLIERALLQYCALYYSVAMTRLSSFDYMDPVAGTLTPRQLECAKLIADGKSDREIAVTLGLSEATVNRHVELAKQSLDVGTRVQVVVGALRSGQLRIDDDPTHVTISILSAEKKSLKLD
jgi:DNA-binding CsgD family transcriptional regulator